MVSIEGQARIVVLGSGGFIGRQLVTSLRAGPNPIVAVTRNEVDFGSALAKDALVDLLRESDRIVFLAAITPDRGRDVGAMLANIEMLKYFVPALEQTRCSHLTYISSDAVYSDAATLVTEQTPCDPSTLYGVSHVVREKALLEVTRRLNIPLAIIRPCAVYGVGDTHNSYGPNRFIRSAQRDGRIALFGRGEDRRDHLYVGDLCSLIKRTIEAQFDGILNAATGNSVSFHQVAELVSSIASSMASSMAHRNVELVFSERQNPISSRVFDVKAVTQAFPDFTFTLLPKGLSASMGSADTPA